MGERRHRKRTKIRKGCWEGIHRGKHPSKVEHGLWTAEDGGHREQELLTQLTRAGGLSKEGVNGG